MTSNLFKDDVDLINLQSGTEGLEHAITIRPPSRPAVRNTADATTGLHTANMIEDGLKVTNCLPIESSVDSMD